MLYFLFSTEGRFSRSDWLLAFGIWMAAIGFLGLMIIPLSIMGRIDLFVGLMGTLFFMCSCSFICVNAKRLHDRNKSGWWQLIGILPIIGLWMFIEYVFLEGTPGLNRFGPDPLGRTDYRVGPRPDEFERRARVF
jgi:uncharacterized membrane protein YhaH (DUF805 family)